MSDQFKNVDVSQSAEGRVMLITPKPGAKIGAELAVEMVLVWRHRGGRFFLLDLSSMVLDGADTPAFCDALRGFDLMVVGVRGGWAICGMPLIGKEVGHRGFAAYRGGEFGTSAEAETILS